MSDQFESKVIALFARQETDCRPYPTIHPPPTPTIPAKAGIQTLIISKVLFFLSQALLRSEHLTAIILITPLLSLPGFTRF